MRFDSFSDLLTADLSSFLQNAVNSDQINPNAVLACALCCAFEGGVMIRSALEARVSQTPVSLNTKSSAADLVTETDVAVEKAIRSRIASSFPEHLFVGEEGTSEPLNGADRSGSFVWIVDPIDGTTNFVHTFPIVTVSIGFAYGDETTMGVVYNPMTDELWFAWKGCGAFMKTVNGDVVQIRTSDCQSIDTALISTGFAVSLFRRKTANVAAQAALRSIIERNTWELMSKSRDIRRIGGAACDICYVAMGRTDSFFEFGIREWDIAAGLVILHEAGGESSTVGGLRPFSIRGRNVLTAASENLRRELSSVLIDTDVVSIIESIEK